MKAYIISYFGSKSEPTKRLSRLQNHNKQIEWWLNHDQDLDIIILSMEYDSTDYYIHPRVSYIDSPRLNPASARNTLLKIFYDSDDIWALFMDNDSILKQHALWPHTHINFNKMLNQNPSSFKDITIIMPHSDIIPGDGAFTKKYNGTDSNYSNIDWNKQLCFDRMFLTLKGSLFYLQNKKQNIFMEDLFFPAEDHEFALHHYVKGYQTYRLRNIMLYEYASPSTWAKTKTDRVPLIQSSFNNMSSKYSLPERRKWLRHITKNLNIDHPKRLLLPYNTQI